MLYTDFKYWYTLEINKFDVILYIINLKPNTNERKLKY